MPFDSHDPARRRLLGSALAAALTLLGGCAAPPPAATTLSRRRPFWPAGPDRPRFMLEATLRTPGDILGDSSPSPLLRELAGSGGTDQPAFDKPSAIVARGGRIYVADSVRRRVVVFDVPRRRLFAIGVRERGRLAKPAGLALDRDSNLYVADATARTVQVYDALGLPTATIGSRGDLERPTGVAADPAGSRIYVVDRSTNESDGHGVRVFARGGERLPDIGRRGAGEGEFNVPVAAATAPDGTLYVLDAGNFRVQAFTPEGAFLRAFGRAGASVGDFARPRGLAVDAQGRVYVTDASFGNVQVFEPDGRLLLAIGSAAREEAPGRYGLPFGVAVDETGRVYVVDQLFNKIEVIRPLTEAEGEALLRA